MVSDVGRTMLAVALMLGLAITTPATAAVLNGSFELGENPPLGNFTSLGTGSTRIAHWVVTGSGVDWVRSTWPPSHGSYSLDLNQSAAGGVAQTFSTVGGRTYEVLFNLAGNPAGDPKLKQLRVTADQQSADYDFSTVGQTLASMGWQERRFVFTADDHSATLVFTSLTSGAFGPALDNVRVTPIPEPAAAALVVAGLLLVATRGRRA